MQLFETPKKCRVKRTFKPMYHNMSAFELAARHLIAREHGELDTCRDIEQAVSGLDEWHTAIIKKLKYYKPII